VNGIELIRRERARQRAAKGEGWTAAHDDGHDEGELALAGVVYALPPEWRKVVRHVNGVSIEFDLRRLLWPWRGDFKQTPQDRIRELTKAGALVAAEIDRLLRAASS